MRYEDTGEFATASCDVSQGRQPRDIFTSGHFDPHIAIPLLEELGVDVVGSFFGDGGADRYRDLARGLLPEDIPERLLLASLCPLTSKLTCSHGELSLMTWANDKSARSRLVAELFAKLTIPARRAQLQAMVVDIASMLDACQRCELFLRHANRTGFISVLLKHVHDSRACKHGLTIPAATFRSIIRYSSSSEWRKSPRRDSYRTAHAFSTQAARYADPGSGLTLMLRGDIERLGFVCLTSTVRECVSLELSVDVSRAIDTTIDLRIKHPAVRVMRVSPLRPPRSPCPTLRSLNPCLFLCSCRQFVTVREWLFFESTFALWFLHSQYYPQCGRVQHYPQCRHVLLSANEN